MAQQYKLRIFLSSALDADVLADRAAVETAMKAQSVVELISSDNFAASGQSVREVSLDAVRHADVYVGVFASRCGLMTLEEYQLARAREIECLLFFRDDHSLPDTSAERETPTVENYLDVIRKSVEGYEGPLYKKYSDPKDLRALVGEAVTYLRDRLDLFGRAARIAGGVPRQLAKLCDRSAQELIVDDMVNLARGNAEDKPRMLVMGVPGPDNEDHNSFVDWYYDLRLREDFVSTSSVSSLAADDNVNGILCQLKWPTEGASVDERVKQLRRELAKAVAPQPTRGNKTKEELEKLIVQSLNGVRRDVTLRYHLTSSQIQSMDRAVLEQWLTWLLGLPISTGDYLVTVIFCFQQRPAKFLGIFSRKSPHLDACANVISQRNQAWVRVLPQLTPPRQDDAERWADTRCPRYHKSLDTAVLLLEARGAFVNRKAIPFAELRPVLETALEKAYAAYHARALR